MLFDNNIDFITYNSNKLFKERVKLNSIEDGFSKGNMFEEIYKPYKNYQYSKVIPKDERNSLLLEIMSISFAITDLGLYLDLHPEDTKILEKLKKLVEESCKKEMEYVKKYGPLELIDNDKDNYFAWIKNPWPWSDMGVKYV